MRARDPVLKFVYGGVLLRLAVQAGVMEGTLYIKLCYFIYPNELPRIYRCIKSWNYDKTLWLTFCFLTVVVAVKFGTSGVSQLQQYL